MPIITCRPCASRTFPCCPPLFVFASGFIGAFRRGLLARAAPADERSPGPAPRGPAAPQPVPLRAGGAGRGRGLAEELAHHWLSRGAGAAPGTYYCVPRTVSGRSVVRMRGGCCAGRRGWGERRGCRGRGAGARGAGAEARGAGAASQSRQPPPPAGAVQQRMPASRSPLLCAPAISSTSSWIRAARWGWGTAASAPAKPAPQAWPARWVSSAGLLQPSAPRCPAPPGRGWRDREFLFACGFPCLPLLPVAARRAHALGGSRGPAAAARAASAEAPRAGRSVPDSGPGSPPCALPVTPRAVLRPRLRGRFFIVTAVHCWFCQLSPRQIFSAVFVVRLCSCVRVLPAMGPVPPGCQPHLRSLGRSLAAPRLFPRSVPSRWSWSWGTEPRSGRNPPWRASPTTGWCLSEGLSTATFSTLWRKSSFTCTRASPGRKEVVGSLLGWALGGGPERVQAVGLCRSRWRTKAVASAVVGCRGSLPPLVGLSGVGRGCSLPLTHLLPRDVHSRPPVVSELGPAVGLGPDSFWSLGGGWHGVSFCPSVGAHWRFLPTCYFLLAGVVFSRYPVWLEIRMPVHVLLFRFWYLCLDSFNTLRVHLLGFIFLWVHKEVSKGALVVHMWCICTHTSLAGRHVRSLLFSDLFPEPCLSWLL